MAADEDDLPFRWSLFLPAPTDTPSMRGMKYAVIGMGVVLVLGFFVILARIVYLTSRVDASLPAGADVRLAIPKGAEVRTMSLSGNRLAVHLSGPAPDERSIMILDLRSGAVEARIKLDAAPPAPATPAVPVR